MGRLLYGLVALSVITKSCTLGSGGSGGTSGSPALAVPYVGQENGQYCGPASILMWALYDGVTGLAQTQIANHIGTSLSSGSSPQQIATGVNYFTRSGKDASLSYAGGTNEELGIYYSEEVTSINSAVPYVTFINGFLHAGVARGGSWHFDDSSSLYVWDSVIFQDPFTAPDQVYFAAQWTDENVGHIVSYSASQQATYNYDTYGGNVALRGSSGVIRPSY